MQVTTGEHGWQKSPSGEQPGAEQRPQKRGQARPQASPVEGEGPEDRGWQRRRRVRVSHGNQGKRLLEQKTGASSGSGAESW